MREILAEDINFTSGEIIEFLNKLDDMKQRCKVNQLIYYPYIFFEFALERKSFIYRTGDTVGCTIDTKNEIGAIIDTSPKYKEKLVDKQSIIQSKIKFHKAKEIAKQFLYESIARRMKVLSMPKLVLNCHATFYRPYWIIEWNKQGSNNILITVDAVTGKYHPL